MRLAVVGATGYVGSALIPSLIAQGHEVLALGRRSSSLPRDDNIVPVEVDVADEAATRAALTGCGAAYYLVHSMAAGPDFARADRTLAERFAAAARDAGVGRIVYLGALGHGELSMHLESRHEVGEALNGTGVPVVELRAAVVLGSGSISFEMLRYLTERLPVMVCPRWIATRVQPIAEGDLLAMLVESLGVAPGVYEIGGPEVTSYREMIDAYARVRGLGRRTIVDVPVLTPKLSARWVDFVTPVDRKVSHELIESLTSEVIVHDRSAESAFSVRPVGLDDAIRAALDTQANRVSATVLDRADGLDQGIFTMRATASIARHETARVATDLRRCGGDLRWYGAPILWRIRLLAGRALGERTRLRRPCDLERGAEVDWWIVHHVDRNTLVLETRDWRFGEAWLAYRLHGTCVEQVGALRARGLTGFLYWQALRPVHRYVFQQMVRRRAAPPAQTVET